MYAPIRNVLTPNGDTGGENGDFKRSCTIFRFRESSTLLEICCQRLKRFVKFFTFLSGNRRYVKKCQTKNQKKNGHIFSQTGEDGSYMHSNAIPRNSYVPILTNKLLSCSNPDEYGILIVRILFEVCFFHLESDPVIGLFHAICERN